MAHQRLAGLEALTLPASLQAAAIWALALADGNWRAVVGMRNSEMVTAQKSEQAHRNSIGNGAPGNIGREKQKRRPCGPPSGLFLGEGILRSEQEHGAMWA
jgi:hypothetical protein